MFISWPKKTEKLKVNMWKFKIRTLLIQIRSLSKWENKGKKRQNRFIANFVRNPLLESHKKLIMKGFAWVKNLSNVNFVTNILLEITQKSVMSGFTRMTNLLGVASQSCLIWFERNQQWKEWDFSSKNFWAISLSAVWNLKVKLFLSVRTIRPLTQCSSLNVTMSENPKSVNDAKIIQIKYWSWLPVSGKTKTFILWKLCE